MCLPKVSRIRIRTRRYILQRSPFRRKPRGIEESVSTKTSTGCLCAKRSGFASPGGKSPRKVSKVDPTKFPPGDSTLRILKQPDLHVETSYFQKDVIQSKDGAGEHSPVYSLSSHHSLTRDDSYHRLRAYSYHHKGSPGSYNIDDSLKPAKLPVSPTFPNELKDNKLYSQTEAAHESSSHMSPSIQATRYSSHGPHSFTDSGCGSMSFMSSEYSMGLRYAHASTQPIRRKHINPIKPVRFDSEDFSQKRLSRSASQLLFPGERYGRNIVHLFKEDTFSQDMQPGCFKSMRDHDLKTTVYTQIGATQQTKEATKSSSWPLMTNRPNVFTDMLYPNQMQTYKRLPLPPLFINTKTDEVSSKKHQIILMNQEQNTIKEHAAPDVKFYSTKEKMLHSTKRSMRKIKRESITSRLQDSKAYVTADSTNLDSSIEDIQNPMEFSQTQTIQSPQEERYLEKYPGLHATTIRDEACSKPDPERIEHFRTELDVTDTINETKVSSNMQTALSNEISAYNYGPENLKEDYQVENLLGEENGLPDVLTTETNYPHSLNVCTEIMEANDDQSFSKGRLELSTPGSEQSKSNIFSQETSPDKLELHTLSSFAEDRHSPNESTFVGKKVDVPSLTTDTTERQVITECSGDETTSSSTVSKDTPKVGLYAGGSMINQSPEDYTIERLEPVLNNTFDSSVSLGGEIRRYEMEIHNVVEIPSFQESSAELYLRSVEPTYGKEEIKSTEPDTNAITSSPVVDDHSKKQTAFVSEATLEASMLEKEQQRHGLPTSGKILITSSEQESPSFESICHQMAASVSLKTSGKLTIVSDSSHTTPFKEQVPQNVGADSTVIDGASRKPLIEQFTEQNEAEVGEIQRGRIRPCMEDNISDSSHEIQIEKAFDSPLWLHCSEEVCYGLYEEAELFVEKRNNDTEIAVVCDQPEREKYLLNSTSTEILSDHNTFDAPNVILQTVEHVRSPSVLITKLATSDEPTTTFPQEPTILPGSNVPTQMSVYNTAETDVSNAEVTEETLILNETLDDPFGLTFSITGSDARIATSGSDPSTSRVLISAEHCAPHPFELSEEKKDSIIAYLSLENENETNTDKTEVVHYANVRTDFTTERMKEDTENSINMQANIDSENSIPEVNVIGTEGIDTSLYGTTSSDSFVSTKLGTPSPYSRDDHLVFSFKQSPPIRYSDALTPQEPLSSFNSGLWNDGEIMVLSNNNIAIQARLSEQSATPVFTPRFDPSTPLSARLPLASPCFDHPQEVLLYLREPEILPTYIQPTFTRPFTGLETIPEGSGSFLIEQEEEEKYQNQNLKNSGTEPQDSTEEDETAKVSNLIEHTGHMLSSEVDTHLEGTGTSSVESTIDVSLPVVNTEIDNDSKVPSSTKEDAEPGLNSMSPSHSAESILSRNSSVTTLSDISESPRTILARYHPPLSVDDETIDGRTELLNEEVSTDIVLSQSAQRGLVTRCANWTLASLTSTLNFVTIYIPRHVYWFYLATFESRDQLLRAMAGRSLSTAITWDHIQTTVRHPLIVTGMFLGLTTFSPYLQHWPTYAFQAMIQPRVLFLPLWMTSRPALSYAAQIMEYGRTALFDNLPILTRSPFR